MCKRRCEWECIINTWFYNMYRRLSFLSRSIQPKFELYSNYRPTSLNLNELFKFGMCVFIWCLIFVRFYGPSIEVIFIFEEWIAREDGPYNAGAKTSSCGIPWNWVRIQDMYNVIKVSFPYYFRYDQHFNNLLKYEACDVTRPTLISNFTDELREILERHSSVVALMASVGMTF